MAKTVQEVVDEVNVVKTSLDQAKAALVTMAANDATFRADVTAAFNHLEGIAGGADAQAAFDALQPLKQVISDENQIVSDNTVAIETADAAAKVEATF